MLVTHRPCCGVHMWYRKVVPHIEQLIGRRWRSAQHIDRRLCIEGLLGAHNQRRVPLWLICIRIFYLLRCTCTHLQAK